MKDLIEMYNYWGLSFDSVLIIEMELKYVLFRAGLKGFWDCHFKDDISYKIL